MSLKVKQIRVGPTFISSTKDVVAASNCYVHCNNNDNSNGNFFQTSYKYIEILQYNHDPH